MTEYEKLSLALLNTIAQGISLQMTQLDSIQPPRGMGAGHDYDSISRFAGDRAKWQGAAARLTKLVAAGQLMVPGMAASTFVPPAAGKEVGA